VLGESENHGRFEGTLDRGLSLWTFGFPCDRTTSCTISGFTWTLTPH
jgi:hypothetical protein